MIIYVSVYHSFAVIEKGSRNNNSYQICEIIGGKGQIDWPIRVIYRGADAKRLACFRADLLEEKQGLGEIEITDGDIYEDLPRNNDDLAD